jgi:glycosyltransferase involved in cell wall biosynthesis
MTQSNVTLVIPSANNLRHLKNAYESIVRNAPDVKFILLDDGSTDGTWEWIQSIENPNLVAKFRSEDRQGHTILYDMGIYLAKTEVVGIIHADMLLGPNYVENLLKHLQPGRVVCGTRVEPPLHPEGKEKIVRDFGMDFDSLDIVGFEKFALKTQTEVAGQTSRGMFAPWIIYKEDFQKMGGHDPIFAPFPYEDSDIFQRWILSGYELIQSRDALVYHLTCRGHRWTEEVGKDDLYYKAASERAAKNYLRKWGSWIRNDEWQYPIIPPVYDISYRIHNCDPRFLSVFEPMATRVYVDSELIEPYIQTEQPNTLFRLSERVKDIELESEGDIIVEFDARQLTQQAFTTLQQLPQIIQKSSPGVYEVDIFAVQIDRIEDHSPSLANLFNPDYQSRMNVE